MAVNLSTVTGLDRIDLDMLLDLIDDRRSALEDGTFSTSEYDAADMIDLADKVRALRDASVASD